MLRASNCSQLYETQVVNSTIQCIKVHHTQRIAHPIAYICKRSPAQFCRLHRDSSQEWTLASSHSRYDRRCRPGRGDRFGQCAHPSVDHRGDSGFGHRSAHHRRVVPTHRHRAVDRSRRLGCATRWVCAAAALACGCRLHAIIGFIQPCAYSIGLTSQKCPCTSVRGGCARALCVPFHLCGCPTCVRGVCAIPANLHESDDSHMMVSRH